MNAIQYHAFSLIFLMLRTVMLNQGHREDGRAIKACDEQYEIITKAVKEGEW